MTISWNCRAPTTSEPEHDAPAEIDPLQVIGNVLIEAVPKYVALHLRSLVGSRRQPSQVSAQGEMARQFVFRAPTQIKRQQRLVGIATAVGFMRKADTASDERPQLSLAVPQHVQEAEAELVEVGVEGFRVRAGGHVALAETGVVVAPHQFGLRAIRERILDEGAEAQAAVHAQAIYGEGICDRIGAPGFVADEWRYFPLCGVAPLS